jgi:hypothetical protein
MVEYKNNKFFNNGAEIAPSDLAIAFNILQKMTAQTEKSLVEIESNNERLARLVRTAERALKVVRLNRTEADR